MASWFGPKGFASLIYALLVFHAGSANASFMFHLSALAIGLSILLHSSTDVVVARWLATHQDLEERRDAGGKGLAAELDSNQRPSDWEFAPQCAVASRSAKPPPAPIAP